MLMVNQLIGFAVGGDSAFAVDAVVFDGTNDYALRGADLTGNAAGKQGIVSAWVKFNGGDGTEQVIWQSGTEQVRILKDASNKIQVFGRTSAGAAIMNATSSTAYTTASGWIHVLCSWNLNTPGGWLYINDADDLDTATDIFLNTANIDYNQSNHAMGARTAADRKFNGDVAELYINYATSLDLSVEANRRKFRGSDAKPVDLGATGATPTGSQPIGYFSVRPGDAATVFAANKGSGGNFTITGTLAISAFSPSD